MTQGPPAWHSDPSGRHQYRWWDGLGYTDQVADNGVVSTDANATPLTSSTPDKPSRAIAVVVGAFVAAMLLSVAVYVVVGGDDGTTGTGTFDGAINGDEPVGVHRVGVHGDVTALTIELDPDRGLDAVVGLAVSRADSRVIQDIYGDLLGIDVESAEDAFGIETGLSDDVRVVFRTDVGFAGDEEEVLLVLPGDMDVQVVVAPFDVEEDGEGDYEVTIDAFSLDADPDDDLEDLLAAVSDNRDIPRDFRDLADEQASFG